MINLKMGIIFLAVNDTMSKSLSAPSTFSLTSLQQHEMKAAISLSICLVLLAEKVLSGACTGYHSCAIQDMRKYGQFVVNVVFNQLRTDKGRKIQREEIMNQEAEKEGRCKRRGMSQGLHHHP